MDIVIHAVGMPFNGETVQTKSLGGSESAAYYQARELARRGHHVTVFTSSQEQGEWDGVTYLWAGEPNQIASLGDRFEFYARNTPHDVLIIQRHPLAFHQRFASKVNIWQLHDLALYRQAAMATHGMWQVDAVTVVSQWHKKQVCEVFGFKSEFVQVVRNGVDPDIYRFNLHVPAPADDMLDEDRAAPVYLYDQLAEQFHPHAEKFKLLYQSRPERGLEHLVRPGGIMDQLADTEAHLFVCSYDNRPQHMQAYYAQLEAWGKALGNVTFLEPLSKPQLAALQKSCDLLVYPTEFEEVSCISAMEAMHAGLPMLTSTVGSLPETCMDSGTMFIPLKDDRADEDAFAAKIREIMDMDREKFAVEAVEQLKAAKTRTWAHAVDQLEAVIERCFERRRGNAGAAIRHCIEHSDIGFGRQMLDLAPASETFGAIVARTEEEIDGLYDFSESPAKYAAHYAKHGGKYYDDFEDKVVGEDVTSTTRFRGVAMNVYKAVEAARGRQLRVLDYGCAHGHYLVPLAKAFPSLRFTGMDVSSRAIGAAMKWVQREGLDVELRIGDQSALKDVATMCPLRYTEESIKLDATTGQPVAKRAERDYFDIIIAGEVVEHVPDWHELLEDFRALLAPGGVIIVTTPIGRWEWTGTEAFREAREHLHHFEKDDIRDLCGRNHVEISCAPAGHDQTGGILGSWVWAVHPTEAFGDIDYERKRARLAPRETVSACMIVKDGEKTIRRCLESVVDWVDEIVIGVDPNTKDRTKQILEQFASDYRWKPVTVFDGVSAIEAGFDEARNRTVEKACGDWVLWLDADEEVQTPWNMWKYLRPSQHDAFGFPQVHYSTNPPQVLTTDYPCRLFRRNGKIKFYGVVHEHPEVEPGKAIPYSAIRHDVQFLHCGYVDETVRRERFKRNLPLLYRDLEKYPDRGLNRFLFLRDIAQQLLFESEQAQGMVLEGQPERAMQGVKVWEQMLEKDPLRVVVDAVKYYSHCVAVLGRGFEAKFSMSVKTDAAPDLACNLATEGRFYSREHFQKFVTRMNEEATKQYESKYL